MLFALVLDADFFISRDLGEWDRLGEQAADVNLDLAIGVLTGV